MRREEFEVKERKALEPVLAEAPVGYLAFNGPQGWPRITPLSFAYDGRVLWHGAMAGERFESLQSDPRATLVAVPRQVYVPSHFTSEENASAASVFFLSVQVWGRCRILEDPEEKCTVLNLLMAKYQPEGKYRRISAPDALYRQILKSTAVYALLVEEMVGKFKLGQNKSDEDRRKISAGLRERGTEADLFLAEEILKMATVG